MHKKELVYKGRDLNQAKKALIMIHGRGGSADDILSLSGYFKLADFALIAPQASNRTWYPYSFLSKPQQNEPWLSSALDILKKIVIDVETAGITTENIYFLGFSQGACLVIEFITRNAQRYGGAAIFTGGLIGDKIYKENYQGDFRGTHVFIGSSDPDPHVPVERVDSSAELLIKMNASVTKKIYPGMGHTISQDEIEQANQFIF